MTYSHCSKVPAFLQVLDIAGLVKGASEGQGLGNAFLSHIKQCDAIFHMSSKLQFISSAGDTRGGNAFCEQQNYLPFIMSLIWDIIDNNMS